MITFRRIESVTDHYFTELYDLYSVAFPPGERRNWAGLEHELAYEKRFHAHALLQNDQFVGFFNYWTFERFLYLEHFAIDSNLRGQLIGRKVMEKFREQAQLPIVLEVEMPNNSMAIRRIRFYEELGYTVLSHYYAQPPYDGKGFLLPMLLMSNDNHFASTHFDLIKDTLYRDVYHYKDNK